MADLLAAVVLKAILQEDVVQASEAALEGDEVVDTMFALNNYMFELALDGVSLGFTEITDTSDPMTVPRGTINGIIKNVAEQIAVQFGVPVPPELAIQAKNGRRVMTKAAVSIPATPFPGNLPIGSGNECGDGVRFYGNTQTTIDTESGAAIIPETNTEIP